MMTTTPLSINNGITYCGFATVKQLRNDKVVKEFTCKNHGTELLFTILAASLAGQNQSINMPKYFDMGNTIVNENTQEQIYSPVIHSRVSVDRKFIRNYIKESLEEILSAKVAAVFTAYIPSRLINENAQITTLSLYSKFEDNDRDSLLAEIELPTATTLTASDVYSYMVEWVMTFQNVTTVTTPVGGTN